MTRYEKMLRDTAKAYAIGFCIGLPPIIVGAVALILVVIG